MNDNIKVTALVTHDPLTLAYRRRAEAAHFIQCIAKAAIDLHPGCKVDIMQRETDTAPRTIYVVNHGEVDEAASEAFMTHVKNLHKKFEE